MKNLLLLLLCLSQLSKAETFQTNPNRTVYTFGADRMKLNSSTAKIVEDQRLKGKKGITLKERNEEAKNTDREADISIDLTGVKPGRYVMRTQAFTDEKGYKVMSRAKSKYESLFTTIQVEGQKKTRRVIFVPWQVDKQPSRQVSGKFEITTESKQLNLWLPEGVILENIGLHTYVPPAVPKQLDTYQPKIVPPKSRPRLWVNAQSLPEVKNRLTQGENKPVWERVKKEALQPFEIKPLSPEEEISHDPKLEKAAEAKAFYFLMTGDKKIGREAIEMMKNYISHVEFGNLLDITREIGRAIYFTSLVYDWCHELISEDEKKVFVKHLMRLSDDMEIGWPPFLQTVVNGHGNEAQVCRDLLSMSIAIYDENPEPYKYTSYLILEQLVPMRNFEYQSPRHNQGINYGAFRFTWDMHAAWLYYRMTGQPVFDDNIKGVRQFWLYARLPDGEMLRDGDGFGAAVPGKTYYWRSPLSTLLTYTYASDSILKGEFERQIGARIRSDLVLFLLLNNPDLISEKSRESLPLTKDFGRILGSMIVRTGWDISETSDDVVAEIKGGGYHFGNHQHSDAGSIQLYYRGLQLGDLGVYKFYGTPYDFNFNKRSISHSMMLAVDPDEKFTRAESNDGGTKFNQRAPKSPKEVQADRWFDNGEVLSTDFGPVKLKPYYSYFSANLTNAYGNNKLDKYVRSFCFLNLNRKDIPAVIILRDKMKTREASFKKYWQINTFNEPIINAESIILSNQRHGRVGKTHIKTLLPLPSEQNVEVLSGDLANNSFRHTYTPPALDLPETRGHRIMLSPKRDNKEDEFLTVFQVASEDTTPLPVKHLKTDVSDVIVMGDNIISMNRLDNLIDKRFEIEVPQGKNTHVILTGLKEGRWKVLYKNRASSAEEFSVGAGKNTLYFQGKKGKYVVLPNF